jgi:YfiH family protein
VRPEDQYQPRSPEEVREGFDAMVAPEPGVSLLIKMADCQGVLLYDPASKILGLAHSGWRGSVRNILAKTVGAMAGCGADPGRMLAGVAPSLGPCCAEFVNYRAELPEEFWNFRVNETHFDFWAISRKQLTDCGLKAENIEIAGICTKCSPEYFSYRRGDDWGRFGLLAGVVLER